MEQRPLRLGDILDDYCPRERRLTNHAVVAIVEDTVKQTRCTTCDAEHPYKGGQAPRRKRKDAPAPAIVSSAGPEAEPDVPSVGAAPVENPTQSEEEFHEEEIAPDIPEIEEPPVHDVEDGPVHRPLIRATLPRPEGQKDARTPPDFTVRQPGSRGGNNAGNAQFRGGGGNRPRQRSNAHGGNGHRSFGGNAPGSGGSRFGARPAQGQGHHRGHGGFRSGQQPRQGGGGRKRSR